MAKPTTSFSKRENEKNKAAKRLEKQKRKDERKSGATGSSFDDMIAYVDQYGNLTDVPPEEKEEINLEDIIIATPKKDDTIEEAALNGRVEHFNAGKGYGFIKELTGGEKYFFHISSAPQDIAEGKAVFFELERGTRGMNAVKIRY